MVATKVWDNLPFDILPSHAISALILVDVSISFSFLLFRGGGGWWSKGGGVRGGGGGGFTSHVT